MARPQQTWRRHEHTDTRLMTPENLPASCVGQIERFNESVSLFPSPTAPSGAQNPPQPIGHFEAPTVVAGGVRGFATSIALLDALVSGNWDPGPAQHLQVSRRSEGS